MRNLVMILVVGACALLWAGAEGANASNVSLSCGATSCEYNEEFKASQTKTFHGHCDANTKMTASNSNMTCHKASGLTCTPGLLENPGKSDTFWRCTCTNWNTKKHSTTIDMTCPAPS